MKRVSLLSCFGIMLLASHAYASSMLLRWPVYVQNPQRPATQLVMQACDVVPPATNCTNFADEKVLTVADTSYASPLQTNIFRCWQLVAMDAMGRSLPSNTFCGGDAVLNAPGALSGTVQTP